MKFKTTQKEIKSNYNKVIAIGYCNLQHLLNYCNPVAYTVSRYGWGADIYTFGGVAIATGYSPFGNVHPNYEVIRKYDKEAEKIIYNYELSYENSVKPWIS